MCSDTSGWDVRLPGQVWIGAEDGILHSGTGDAIGLTPEAEWSFEHARRTAERWGVPLAQGLAGHCCACVSMVRIDGNANFLDYGVCTSDVSPLDGRIVNMQSGCAAFVAAET
ncbi:DUF3027 domain-containing protein [Pseudoduganella violaceinigra]|uniref:DUF3027 domain-containing protein n=1 Tax=Pseudoduganella violaceinigra TaxID=246602 RepID=UPI0012B58448